MSNICTAICLLIVPRNVVQVFRCNLQNVVWLLSRNCQARTVDSATHLSELGCWQLNYFPDEMDAESLHPSMFICMHNGCHEHGKIGQPLPPFKTVLRNIIIMAQVVCVHKLRMSPWCSCVVSCKSKASRVWQLKNLLSSYRYRSSSCMYFLHDYIRVPEKWLTRQQYAVSIYQH